jgi:hypothetical protein
LGLKAISEPIEIPRSLWGVEAPDATELETLWIKKQSNTNKRKSMTIEGQADLNGSLYKAWAV